MLIKKVGILLLFIGLLFGCASTNNNSFTSKLKKKDPNPEMQKQILENIEVGKMLANYDMAAWKTSDLLMSKAQDISNLGKFFLLNDKVYFGSENDDEFLSYYSVDYLNNKATNFQKYKVPLSIETLTMFSKAVDKSKEINEEFMISQESKYNYYAFEEPTTIKIWWIPAMITDTDVLCGGIRTTFEKSTLKLIENNKLHQSVVKMPMQKMEKNVVMRSHHIVSEIPNEVDFAHFFIKQDMSPEHLITNDNYSFYLNIKNDPIIQFYSNELPVEKTRIFGAIIEIQTDNTGKTTSVKIVEILNLDNLQLIQPTELFKNNCIEMLSSMPWDPEAKTFYYNLYYDTTRPDIPMIFNKKTNTYNHLW